LAQAMLAQVVDTPHAPFLAPLQLLAQGVTILLRADGCSLL